MENHFFNYETMRNESRCCCCCCCPKMESISRTQRTPFHWLWQSFNGDAATTLPARQTNKLTKKKALSSSLDKDYLANAMHWSPGLFLQDILEFFFFFCFLMDFMKEALLASWNTQTHFPIAFESILVNNWMRNRNKFYER